jgi:class 3 adenylate cyclase
MFEVGMGQCEDVDTEKATSSAIERALLALGAHQPQIAMIFAGQDFDHFRMLQIVKTKLGKIQTIGCTTAGELTSDLGFSDDSVIILLFSSDEIEFSIGLGIDQNFSSRAIAHNAISMARAQLTMPEKLCLVFTDSFSISANGVIEELNSELGSKCKVFGGVSARPFGSDYTLKLFYNDQVYENATLILLIAGDVKFAYSVSNTWQPIGRRALVTHSEGKIVYTIDNMRALDYYHYYLGEYSFPAPEFPLAVFEEGAKHFYLRVPGGYDKEAGTILFAGEIAQGCEIQITEASREYILSDLEESSKIESLSENHFSPRVSFAFSCIMRKHILGTQVKREIEILKDSLPKDLPIFGFYTFGEIGPFQDETKSHLHNCTMINLIIGTESKVETDLRIRSQNAVSIDLNSEEAVFNELKNEVRFLQKKLERETSYRKNLEHVKDFHSSMMKTVNFEIETAKQVIQKKNEELEVLNREIELEKSKSDDLLLNILPHDIANQLKKEGRVTPVCFECASILFTDFKNFTTIANNMSPEDLLQELDYFFSFFDKISEKYSLEKLKTIGDAYMCASGLPEPRADHAVAIVNAAWELQNFMLADKDKRRKESKPIWELRIGINSGPLVAGVIGKKKFSYDIWGDAVNIAARLEANSEPGKINISEDTYLLIKDHFYCEPRGKIFAKNKGEIEMFFVTKKLD